MIEKIMAYIFFQISIEITANWFNLSGLSAPVRQMMMRSFYYYSLSCKRVKLKSSNWWYKMSLFSRFDLFLEARAEILAKFLLVFWFI